MIEEKRNLPEITEEEKQKILDAFKGDIWSSDYSWALLIFLICFSGWNTPLPDEQIE